MVCILTSSPTAGIDLDCPQPMLDGRNGLVALLHGLWRPQARCLMIAATPDAHDCNDEMTWFYSEAIKNSGLSWSCFDLWDDRSPDWLGDALGDYDVIFLAGGHVPTQRRWFESIGLKQRLEGYGGLVLGTSAGSMNMAQTVYAWPEEPGESVDPDYELFFPGLGLAHAQVLPHLQKVRDNWLDGKRLVEDIACGDSYDSRFYAIPDGSYILVKDGVERVFGAAWLVSGGEITPLCDEGETRQL